MTIAHSEEVDLWQALDIRLQNVRILIDLVRIVWMITDSGCKCKLPDTVFALLVHAFLCNVVVVFVLLWRWVVTLQLR